MVRLRLAMSQQPETSNKAGVPPNEMYHEFHGQCVYQAEADIHFPLLTTRQTLHFTAEARAPKDARKLSGVTRKTYAEQVLEVTASSLGLSKALATQIGNDFVQGISGGERKRTSIAVCKGRHFTGKVLISEKSPRRSLSVTAPFSAGTTAPEVLTVRMH